MTGERLEGVDGGRVQGQLEEICLCMYLLHFNPIVKLVKLCPAQVSILTNQQQAPPSTMNGLNQP